MEELSLQKTIKQWYEKIPGSARIGVYATFLIGLITNLFVFTNKCLNHDDLMAEFIINTDFDITSGRWTWPVLRKICSYYDLPLLRGVVTMMLLAASVGLIIALFKIKDTVFVILLSALFATFPINACYYSYLSIADIYYFAILFAVLGVFLVNRFRSVRVIGWAIGPVLSAVFICLSLATYQSFLCLTIGLVFIMAFADMLDGGMSVKDWFLKYVRYAVTAALGFVFYWAGTKVILKVTGNALRAYAGTDKMFQFDLSALVKSVWTTYKSQYEFYFTNQVYQHRLFTIVNIGLSLIILGIVVGLIVQNIRRKQIGKALIAAAMTAVTPMILNFIYIMLNGKSSPHMLMKYSTILLYVLVVVLVTHSQLPAVVKSIRLKCVLQWICALCMCVVVYYGALISNQLYQRMYYNTNAIDSMMTSLVTKVTMVEDFNLSEAVFFANFDSFFNENYETSAPFAAELPSYVWMGTDIYPWYGNNHIMRYLSFYQHMNILASNNAGREKAVMETQEFKDMPVYPNEGSVKRIEGLVVVKFANE